MNPIKKAKFFFFAAALAAGGAGLAHNRAGAYSPARAFDKAGAEAGLSSASLSCSPSAAEAESLWRAAKGSLPQTALQNSAYENGGGFAGRPSGALSGHAEVKALSKGIYDDYNREAGAAYFQDDEILSAQHIAAAEPLCMKASEIIKTAFDGYDHQPFYEACLINAAAALINRDSLAMSERTGVNGFFESRIEELYAALEGTAALWEKRQRHPMPLPFPYPIVRTAEGFSPCSGDIKGAAVEINDLFKSRIEELYETLEETAELWEKKQQHPMPLPFPYPIVRTAEGF